MSKFTEAERDADDFAKLVNENTTVETRYGQQPKKSWLYMQNEFNDFLGESRGRGAYYVVGSFESGFTYTDINQTGTYNNNGTIEYYVYTGGLDSLPYTVSAGTNPVEDDNYARVNYNQASQVNTDNGSTVQDFIDDTDTHGVELWKSFSNTSDLIASIDIESGTARTLGFHSSGDGGSCEYVISATPGDFSLSLSNGKYANPINIKSPKQVGWTESGGESNYNIIAEYVNSGYAASNYDTLYSLRYFTSQWIAGNSFPIAFYGDSTTDGATTTGHVANVIAGNNPSNWSAAITITEDENAYPKELERQLKLLIGSGNPVRCYNAGFDSHSLRTGSGQYNEFGNKAFHRVFFGYPALNNVDYSDVKGIVLSWGTSDSINLDDVNTILDSYEWKMELLIIECFERGIQPFIADPVYTNQRRGDLVSGRDNDESVSIIEQVNERLRKKYNIEKLSIRSAIETYAEGAFPADAPTTSYGAKGDFDVITPLPDGVHPNDKGHRMIASSYASIMHPLIASFKGDETYKITAGSFYPFTAPSLGDVNLWATVLNTDIVTRSTYFWRFPTLTAGNEFLYRVFAYCEKPMDLTYDMLSVGVTSRTPDNFPKIYIHNQVESTSKQKAVHTDYTSSVLCSGSHLLIGRLDVGLNVIEVISAAAPIDSSKMGFLRVEPHYDKNKLDFDYLGQSNTQFRNVYSNVEWLQTQTKRLWSNKVMSRDNYAFSAQGTQDRRVKFKANTLHQRDILLNASRKFRDFDTFDLIRVSGTSVEVYKVESDIDGVETESLVASAVSSVDFSTIQDGVFILNIQPTGSGITLYIQHMSNTNAALDVIVGPIDMNSSLAMSNGGYGFGIQKKLSDSAPIYVTDITDEFEH